MCSGNHSILLFIRITIIYLQAGSGVIAETQRNASLVADEIQADWTSGRINKKSNGSDIRELLRRNGSRFVSWSDWKLIDKAERELGAQLGKPREKINDVLSFLAEHDKENSRIRAKD